MINLSRSDYYQGILQLRDVNDEVLNFVEDQIKKRGNVAVTKSVKFANGVDLYITSQKFITMLGKKLRDNFGGQIKISSKLHTTNKQGKNLYRVNVFFRLSKYKKGDTVLIRGDKVRLISSGRKIFARNLKTGKKVTIRSRDFESIQ